MQCLEVMHNISMRLGRMGVRERAFCRVLIFNVGERIAVVTRCRIPRLLNGTPLFAFIGKITLIAVMA